LAHRSTRADAPVRHAIEELRQALATLDLAAAQWLAAGDNDRVTFIEFQSPVGRVVIHPLNQRWT